MVSITRTMAEQLSLPGLEPARTGLFRPEVINSWRGEPEGYTLFLALFPQPEDAQQIARAAAALRGRHGLTSACLPAERLHITLHAVARFRELIPQAPIDAARAAAARVSCTSLPIVFDHAMSFPPSKAFVLRCDASSAAGIARLRQLLALELRRFGLRPDASSTPHMTMLYQPGFVAEHSIAPIDWIATRYALILSHKGITHHQWLGEWAMPPTAS
ncbi:2'-5' RNA ligase family protein [Paucibacter sediminis]|uniref:2'-5' RNA ligase family protein n=1 Tax=Paucibacter sediminis TaxID=3019553 RepID=A0AA95SQW9_9BURK|nr:2'-5' RNA ligase family protein [Paucibacter sp. S2-9]WIT13970.1 2'-5' RNA ligase family protein [Paucibacter sp. S2-9]